MRPYFTRLTERFFRLKSFGGDVLETRMKRCLSTTDITLLGVGHMIGAGIYVLTGSVVRNSTGPSIVLSFILAGFASLLSALCYAEFGARFPKAGSAYTYTYIGVGELWAFVIGWNIVLEHMLGAAAVARSWSGYLDSLLGQAIKNSTITNLGQLNNSSFFGDYPDLVAFVVVIAVAVFIALGSKTSTNFNSVFTLINMCVIIFVVGYGMTFADFDLWTGSDESGVSNFFPMGISGTLAGAASCFFAYIGFDGLATAGEEAANPSRAIPLATFVSMSIVTTAYVSMSAALTLMVPYKEVHPTAAFADAFARRGAVWAKYVVSLGALSGMTTSLVGSMFALPRCVYAMAQDGLIFKTFAHINEKTKVPVNAVVVFGAATAIIALLFDIETLVEFLSIGTLLAYTIVSACVIILRYRPAGAASQSGHLNSECEGRIRAWVPFQTALSTPVPGQTVAWSVIFMTASFCGVSVLFSSGACHTTLGKIGIFILSVISLAFIGLICLHHQSKAQIDFKVPFVPLLPAGSILINVLLMTHLAPITWVRLAFWLTIGFAVYLFYGMKHSTEENREFSQGVSKSTTYESMVSEQVTPQSVALP
ncbi:hypothetical protein QR680_000114 [Steinernema hermaphroditum]|uniref:Cationic amino acid transporter C-terminal domain-containing protein n=1 Tax=Steinernema hermaphroditum TaxID=289476 RepID=A0AA39LDQ8_9BILA|nr:hypothetical protein QR680_000114 [Steinernema hermaphroditum]